MSYLDKEGGLLVFEFEVVCDVETEAGIDEELPFIELFDFALDLSLPRFLLLFLILLLRV